MTCSGPGYLPMPGQLAPLSNQNAYTTWPGGVDPTTPLFNTDNQKFGGGASARGARHARRRSRRSRHRGGSRKTRRGGSRRVRKNLKKASRRARKNLKKVSRRNRKVSRRFGKNLRKTYNRVRKFLVGRRRGGATCTPIDTTGSIASFPRPNSVCPEGSFEQTGRLVAQ